MTNFLKEHFDHLTLGLLAVLGGIGVVWADAHTHIKSIEFFSAQTGACVSALFMRMQAHRASPEPVSPNVPPTDAAPLTPAP